MKLREFHNIIEQSDSRHLKGVKYRFALIFFLSVLAVAAAFFRDLEIPRLLIFLLIIIAVAYNALIYLWIAWGKALQYRAYFSALLDFFLITVAVHYLGGIEAGIFWVYAVGIIAYASIHGLRMGLYTAAISSLLHSSLLVGEFSGSIEHVGFGFLNPEYIDEAKLYLYLRLLSDNFLFLIAALMSGLISEQLVRSRKELEERNRQLRLEIAERGQIEEELRDHHEGLEKLVAERTIRIEATVDRLKEEITERIVTEGKLRDSEDRLKILFEFAPDAYYISNLDGVFIDGNKAAEELIGRHRDELIGTSFADLDMLAPDQIAKAASILAQNIERIPTGPDEIALSMKDGRKVVVELRTYPMEIENQSLVLNIAHDVTDRKRAEEASKESEERYRSLVDSMLSGICIVQDGEVKFVNKWLAEKSGYTREEFLGQPMEKFIHPDDLKLSAEIIARRYEGDTAPRPQLRVITKSGSVHWTEALGTIIEYEGRPALLSNLIDINDRMQAEKTLKESEQRHRSLVERVQDMIVTIDAETGVLTSVNDFAEEVLGYRKEELLKGNSFLEFLHPDDRERVASAFGEQLQKGKGPSIPPFRISKKDGNLIYVEERGIILRDDEGKPSSYLSVMRDITERMEADEALRASEEKYRLHFENVNDVVLSVDRGFRITSISPSVETILGYKPEELIGQTIAELKIIAPESRERISQGIGEVFSGAHVEMLEYEFLKKDGSKRLGELNVAPRRKGGEVVELICVARDITEQKELQQQLFQSQKMESIGTLAGGIAHDFNNILGGILGYASLMKAKMTKGHSFYNYVDTIETGSMRAAQLTDQLLAFARGGKYDIRPVDLNKIIDETLKIINRTFDKSIEVEMQLHDQLPTVEADAGQIQQVIMNLCINAGDAMPGGGKLTIQTEIETLDNGYVKTHMGAKAGEHAVLSVTDTGIGMDSKTSQRIFEPFFSTKGEGKGTGLGLAMVYGVVKNHGGYVDVYSEPGLGTTFKIYLPLSGKPESEASSEAEHELDGNELVLVVDDEEPIRALAKEMLESYGYRVILAEDGERGIEMFEENSGEIGLVILDMVMPNMGGRETFLKMKKINPKVKALLSTGYSQSGKAQEILDNGVLGFIQKPYQLRALLSKVRSVLDS